MTTEASKGEHMPVQQVRQAPCGCNRKALAEVLVEETEVWAIHIGIALPLREALAERFEAVLLDAYRDDMTECDKCATTHGDTLHRCNDANPACLAAASAAGLAERYRRVHRSGAPTEG